MFLLFCAFLLLWHHLVSRDVAPPIKSLLTLLTFLNAWKNKAWEIAFGMNRNSVLKRAFPHMCATHVRYEWKKKDGEKTISNNSLAASKTNWRLEKRRRWYFIADSIFIILLQAFGEGTDNPVALCSAVTGLALWENPLNRSVLMSQVSHWAV